MASFKYWEEGFLAIATGTTTGATSGRALLRLTDITLSTNWDEIAIATFDSPLFSKFIEQTTFGWTVSCSGKVYDGTTESEFQGSSSGDTKIQGVLNGLQLLELAKVRNLNCFIIIKLDDNNYQTGYVKISSYELAGSVGDAINYALELTGNGALTLATS